MTDNYNHLVEFDEDSKRLTIYRVLNDGSKVLFTYLDLGDYPDKVPGEKYRDIARMVGENIFLDSPAARRFFGL